MALKVTCVSDPIPRCFSPDQETAFAQAVAGLRAAAMRWPGNTITAASAGAIDIPTLEVVAFAARATDLAQADGTVALDAKQQALLNKISLADAAALQFLGYNIVEVTKLLNSIADKLGFVPPAEAPAAAKSRWLLFTLLGVAAAIAIGTGIYIYTRKPSPYMMPASSW